MYTFTIDAESSLLNELWLHEDALFWLYESLICMGEEAETEAGGREIEAENEEALLEEIIEEGVYFIKENHHRLLENACEFFEAQVRQKLEFLSAKNKALIISKEKEEA